MYTPRNARLICSFEHDVTCNMTLHSPTTNFHRDFQSSVREKRDVQSTYCMPFCQSTCPLSHRSLERKHGFENKTSKKFKKSTTQHEINNDQLLGMAGWVSCPATRDEDRRTKSPFTSSHKTPHNTLI